MAASCPFQSLAERSFDPSRVIDHPSGFFALSPRNARFTADGIDGFLAYRERGKHLIVFGGVHALPASQQKLLDAFLGFAASRRRRVLVVQLRANQVPLFFDRGFTVNQFGTSFGLCLRRFSMTGSSKMRLRNKISRARKAGLRIVEVGRDVPRDERTFSNLRAVSHEWLREKGKELEFMIGEIGTPEEAMRRIFIAVDPFDKTVGFITYVPVWGRTPGYLHDLTRRLPTAPAGAMELCNAHAIERLMADGIEYLHFGFTPFITDGVDHPGANKLASWLVRQLRRYGGPLYPAESQARYKLKWAPDIVECEYLAARPLSLRGIFDLMILTRSI
jgi:lysylphosphatidylglycerol synthetase-like protein (DUF2156 family)